jgi:hypothetical protein
MGLSFGPLLYRSRRTDSRGSRGHEIVHQLMDRAVEGGSAAGFRNETNQGAQRRIVGGADTRQPPGLGIPVERYRRWFATIGEPCLQRPAHVRLQRFAGQQ